MSLPLIIAYKRLFAQGAARTILKVDRFTFVRDSFCLHGIPHQAQVYLVWVPWYSPNKTELLSRTRILEIAYARELNITKILLT